MFGRVARYQRRVVYALQCDDLGRVNGLSLIWQDEEIGGGFGGPHCMVPAGYGAIVDALAAQLDVRLGCPVASVTDGQDGVLVVTQTGTNPEC